MPLLDTILLAASVAAGVVWTGVSIFVLAVQHRRDRARATLDAVMAALGEEGTPARPLGERVERIRPILERASRELIMHAVADHRTAPGASVVLAAYLLEHWGADTLARDAASHGTPRDKWRRMKALHVLFRIGHPRSVSLAAQAIDERDSDVAAVALSLLGDSEDPEAAEILLDALKRQRHPGSRIAVHLDRVPQNLAARLRPLLVHPDPLVRRWASMLLGRYTGLEGLERDLARTAEDHDPRVRKAAVQSLGRLGGPLAAATALRLLNDLTPFVRAAAARAIAGLERSDLAEPVSVLLGDRDWWVRFAAKACLERMGPDIWPLLVRLLDDPDRFIRNGAAEVFQNLGVLDSFIVMEAASDAPGHRKIDLLRRIAAAGGLRLTDSLLERAGSKLGPRVRHLLSTVGLEHVGVA